MEWFTVDLCKIGFLKKVASKFARYNLHTTHGNCLTLRTLHKQIYIVQHPAGDSVDKIPIHPFHHCRKSSEGHKAILENTEVRATLSVTHDGEIPKVKLMCCPILLLESICYGPKNSSRVLY